MLVRLLAYRIRRALLGPSAVEFECSAKMAIRFTDRVLAAIDAMDEREALPWQRSTLADRRELLAARSAAVCLLRDLSIGRPARRDLVVALLGDEIVSAMLHERGLLT